VVVLIVDSLRSGIRHHATSKNQDSKETQ